MRCRIGSLGLKVLVLVFTLVLGVSLTRIVHRVRNPYIHCPAGYKASSNRLHYGSLPRVTLCDLRATPELYEGKVVLLPMKARQPDMLPTDEICVKGDSNFDLEFVGGSFHESGAEEFWRGGAVTLAGRFSKRPIAGDSPKYQFQVLEVVKARLFVAPQ